MKYTTLVVAAALACVQSVRGQLMVNTPTSLVQCQPNLFSWQGGAPPYYLSLIPGGEPSAAALESWAATDATSFTWIVGISAGTSVTVSAKDSTGAIAYSDAVTVQPGSQTNCTSSGAPPPVGSGGPTAPLVATTGAASAAPSGSAPSGSSPASVAPSGSASHSAPPTGTQAAASRQTGAAVSGFSAKTVTGLVSFIAIAGALVF